MRHVPLGVLVVLVVGLSAGCSTAGDDTANGSGLMVHEGSWYSREAWPHDGKPIESANFVVYSDSAGLEARHEVATVAERMWAELLDELSIGHDMLRYPEGRDKIDIYAYHDHDPQDWAGQGYYGGLLVWSPDHERRQTGSDLLRQVVKHELVHVIQWLITGGESRPVDTWFIEGLPLTLAGDTTAIEGLDQLNRLTTAYRSVSPISIKRYSQISDPDAGEHFYYPMFELAVRYLTDDDGHGRTPADMTDMLVEMAEGVPFEVAFEDHMGLRLDEYDREFFDLMSAYLPRYRNPMFSPVGFTVVAALVIVFVVIAVGGGHRRRRLAPGFEPGTESRGRVARIGFYGGATIAVALVVGVFLALLYAIGTEDALYNAAYTRVRLLAYAILAAYLLVSIALLRRAVHRWALRARSAFLVAPLVVAATAFTIGVFTIGARAL